MRGRLILLVLVTLLVFGLGAVVAHGQDGETAAIELVVESFYVDYLGLLQSNMAYGTGSPLIAGKYRSSPYLTPGWIANVDNILATIENGSTLVDPFLMTQDVPERIEVEVTEVWAEGAETLVRQYFSGNPFPHNITVLLNNRDGWKIDYIVDGENVTPEGVVEAYYTWYLGYLQPDARGNLPNPLADQAYVNSPYLSPQFITDVIQIVSSTESLVVDPFLGTQDVPQAITVERIRATDTDAAVLLHLLFAGNSEPAERLVTLTWGGDFWQIDRVSEDVPADVVAALFYNNYIAYRRYDIEQLTGRRPLVDWASGLEALLDASLHETLERAFELGDALRVDPVLCAQGVPDRVDATVVNIGAAQVSVRMDALYAAGGDSFDHAPLAIVDMAQVDEHWLIVGITCAP